MLGYNSILALCKFNGTLAFTEFKKKYSNKQCIGLDVLVQKQAQSER